MNVQVIQSSKAPNRMYCIRRAYSMSALLFKSSNHSRFMLPYAELILHESLLGNRIGGNSSSSLKSISDSSFDTKRNAK